MSLTQLFFPETIHVRWPRHGLVRRCLAAVGVSAALGLAACSSNVGDAPGDSTGPAVAQSTISISLSSTDSAGAAPKATGDNLLDLSGAWGSWSAGDSAVSYDAAAGNLTIPASSPEQGDVVLGVRRFDQGLTEGVQYTLSVQSDNPDAAAILFLFDQSGSIMPAG